jgi:hypothetical protein
MFDPISLLLAHKVLAALVTVVLSYAVVKYFSLADVREWIVSRWNMYKHRNIVAATIERDINADEYSELKQYISVIWDLSADQILDCVDVVPEEVSPDLREYHAEEKVRIAHPCGRR